LCPKVEIVDISHKIEKFNIRMGAFVLASVAPCFPTGAVHMGVVDPEVGAKRLLLIVETKRAYFVGPDNGLLMLAAIKERIQHVYGIKNSRFIQSKISKTFHGRDIFAPAAAYLAGGSEAVHLGDEIKDYVVPTYAKPRVEKGTVFVEILYIDSFGNLITNISERLLNKITASKDESLKIAIRGEAELLKLSSTYSDVPVGPLSP
ncbi:SAM-dependent chlorinase/fluorinase, partial [Candidatus Bathyarchaeota archaeon]|nr:SAM-dependent chlorinase/fluorinase [Candidatus Bathyarchaeota archaeon]